MKTPAKFASAEILTACRIGVYQYSIGYRFQTTLFRLVAEAMICSTYCVANSSKSDGLQMLSYHSCFCVN